MCCFQFSCCLMSTIHSINLVLWPSKRIIMENGRMEVGMLTKLLAFRKMSFRYNSVVVWMELCLFLLMKLNLSNASCWFCNSRVCGLVSHDKQNVRVFHFTRLLTTNGYTWSFCCLHIESTITTNIFTF